MASIDLNPPRFGDRIVRVDYNAAIPLKEARRINAGLHGRVRRLEVQHAPVDELVAQVIALFAGYRYAARCSSGALRKRSNSRCRIASRRTRMPEFTVALAASSALRVPTGWQMVIEDVPTRLGTVKVTWWTEYAEEGFTPAIPRELWIELRGIAPNLDAAVTEYEHAGRVLTAVLALVGNGSIDDPDLRIAFDSTPGVAEHEFVQHLLAHETGAPRNSRAIPLEVAGRVVTHVLEHAETQRIHRAIAAYFEALKHWRAGHEVQAVMYLWMAVESLTRAVVRVELQRRGLKDEDALAEAWGLNLSSATSADRARAIAGAARRILIFHGDDETYRGAKAVSDGLEHAFRNLPELHGEAPPVRDKAAWHVRHTIFDLLPLHPDERSALTTIALDQPVDVFTPREVLRGTLVGPGEGLAADGQRYPHYDYETKIVDTKQTSSDGGVDVTFTSTYTKRFGVGVTVARLERALFAPNETGSVAL